MKFFNKYFFIGLGSGILLFILINIGFFVIVTRAFRGSSPEKEDNKEVSLRQHTLMNDRRTSAYEQPGDWSITTLEGDTVEFSQYMGKVVFLNIWATWCPPCVNELPGIQDLYKLMKDEDIAFMIASREEKETVQKFLEKNQFNFPVYLISGELPYGFKSRSIPATIILDREGVIAFKYIGAADWNSETCRNFLQALL